MFFLSAVIILDFSEFVHSLFVEKTLTIVREYPYLLLVGTLHREKILHSRFWQNRSWLHWAAQPLYHDWKRNPLKAPQTLQCPQIGRNRHRISKTLTKLFTLVILIQAIIEMVEQLTEYALMLSCTRLPSTFLAMKILLLCSITPLVYPKGNGERTAVYHTHSRTLPSFVDDIYLCSAAIFWRLI